MTHITPERMDELWQQAFDDTHEGGTISHRFAALLFAEPAPVQEPVATKLETQQFNCFHVSAEDFQRLKALPVGAKLYTTAAPIPDAITDNSESVEYKAGFNECRELTIQMRKP